MIGALLALFAIGGVIYYVHNNFQDLGLLEEPYILIILLVSVFGLGILISFVSTYFATQRFLNLRTDELYY
jgi:cell division transport system permease protein